MTDVLPCIAGLLDGLAPVEPAFPDIPAKLPVIVLTETGNSASVILSGCDRYSIITIQLDVYAEDTEIVRGIALDAGGLLAAKGIRRTFSQLITDEDTPRMCMRFRFGLDEATGRVVSL